MVVPLPKFLPITVTLAENDGVMVDGAAAQIIRKIVEQQAFINAVGRGDIEIHWAGLKVNATITVAMDDLPELAAQDDIAA